MRHTGTFQNYFQGIITYDDFLHEMTTLVLYFVYLAIAEFITVYVATVGFIYTGEHISAKIREHYLESCMRQNIGFFDKLGAGEVTTRITADTNLIQDGMSEKVSITLAAVATFFAAFIIGKLSLGGGAAIPVSLPRLWRVADHFVRIRQLLEAYPHPYVDRCCPSEHNERCVTLHAQV